MLSKLPFYPPKAVVVYYVTIVATSNRTWVVEEIFVYDNKLRSTHCRELKLS